MVLLLCFYLCCFAVATAKDASVSRTQGCGKRIIGYHQSWGDHLLTEQQTSFLTHVIFAFMETLSDGTVRVGSADADAAVDIANETALAESKLRNLVALRTAANADFQTLFAVGGWENSQYFSHIARDAGKTERFIQTSLELLEQYHFDGIDIDWEYPVKGGATDGIEEDKTNYAVFLKKIRDAMAGLQSRLGRTNKYLLTLAGAAGKWTLDAGYDLPSLIGDDGPVDWINVMTYDYYGAWESQWGAYTGPPSPLWFHAPKRYAGNMNADWTIKYYACRSEHPEKIVMGVPFYGRYWLNVGEPVDGKVSGHWRKADAVDGKFLGGFASWAEIVNMWANIDGMYHEYDNKVGAPWAYDSSRRLFLGYEDLRSVAEKVVYAKDKNLGGLMFWSLDLDDESMSMLRALVAQDLCNMCTDKKIAYKCSPIKEQRWWTLVDDVKLGGMCGRSAPIYKGYYPICDPEDPAYSCCGNHGWCGSDAEFCTCDDCVDYSLTPEKALDDPIPKYPIRYYTMDAPEGQRGRCGYDVPLINATEIAVCNGDDPLKQCCSNGGYCGKGDDFCKCEGCIDFKEMPDFKYPEKRWFSWPDPNAGRCGLDAPQIKGKPAICNPLSSNFHCCSSGGYCGTGPEFCDCAGCLNFKQNPDQEFKPRKWFVWPHADAGKCGEGAPRINGEIAECDPSSSQYHCCSASGYCGTGADFCECSGCRDFSSDSRRRIRRGIFDTIGKQLKEISRNVIDSMGGFQCSPDAKPITDVDQLDQEILGNHIRVYASENFEGESIDLSAYAERMPDGWNDKTQSVKCLVSQESACTFVVFAHNDFSGISMMFDRQSSNLGELKSQVSSLMAFPVETSSLCVSIFEDAGFQGATKRICGDTANLKEWTTSISSLRMDCSDCSAVLFDDTNFFGRYLSIGTIDNLAINLEGWNDQVRSIQVRPWKAQFESTRLPEIEVYSEQNFGGEFKKLGPINENLGDWNDKIQSLKCRSLKCSVFAFEDAEFSSLSVFLGNNVKTVGKSLDGKISSLAVMPIAVDDVCVTVYSAENFEGSKHEFCGDAATLGTFNDGVKSWKFTECSNCGIIVYEHSFFRGRFKGFSSAKSLPSDWSNEISSIQVRPWHIEDFEGIRMPEIEAFTGPQLDGDSKIYSAMVEYVGDDMNDKISSFNCLHAQDCVVIGFEHSSMGGFSRMFSGGIRDLQGLNDQISSMFALPKSKEEICVEVFKNNDYGGDSTKFCGDVENVGGDWNDEITSLRLTCDECSVIVYKESWFNGEFKAFNSTGNIGGSFNDEITSLQVRPYKIPSEFEGRRGSSGSGSNCEDSTEADVHSVVQWIPFIGTLYEIGSSIGYAAAGCNDVAAERAIGAGIGLLTDAAVALTGGAAGAFVYSVKTGAKIGFQAGVKALGTALKASVQSAVKVVINFSKQGIKKMVVSTSKTAFSETVSIIKGVKGLVQGSIKGTGKGIMHLSKHGFKQSLKDLNKKLAQVGAKTIDDIAAGVQKKIDDIEGPAGPQPRPGAPNVVEPGRPVDPSLPSPGRTNQANKLDEQELDEFLNPESTLRCRRGIDDVCNRLKNVAIRRMDSETVDVRKNLFNRLNNGGNDLTAEITFKGETMTAKVYKTNGELNIPSPDGGSPVTEEVANKLIFENLQNYIDFVPVGSGFKKVGNQRRRLNYRPPLQVQMAIGGRDRVFSLISSSEIRHPKTTRHIFVHTEASDYPSSTAVISYKNAVRDMEATPSLFLGGEDLKRLQKQRAELLLDSIETHWEDNKIWETAILRDEEGLPILADGKQVHLMGPQQVRSGVELIAITQIAEAAPPERSFFDALLTTTKKKMGIPPSGRTPGMDKLARQALREIKDGSLTFNQVFGSNGVFVAAQKRGTEAGRRLMRGLLDKSPYDELVERMSESTRNSLPAAGA